MAQHFDVFNLHKEEPISHHEQRWRSPRLQKEAITAGALMCPAAPGPRWQGRRTICAKMAKPIITSLRPRWIPLDVGFHLQKSSLKETITRQTFPFELTRWGQQCRYEVDRWLGGREGVGLRVFFVHGVCGWPVNTYDKTSVSSFNAYANRPGRLCVASFTF